MAESQSHEQPVDPWDAVCAFTGWWGAMTKCLRDTQDATLLQYWIFLLLKDAPGQSIAQMQQRLELNYTTIAECVNALASQGLLLKTENDNDKRATTVTLTPEGERRLQQLDAIMVDFSYRIWEKQPKDSRKQVLRMFYRACCVVDKVRTMDGLIRGDTEFLAFCAQFSMEFTRACDKVHLSIGSAMTLMLLARNPAGMRAKDIASAIGKRECDTSKILVKMEQKGLVSRTRGSCRREKRVTITDSGRESASLLNQAAINLIDTYFDTPEDRRLLADVLPPLADHWRSWVLLQGRQVPVWQPAQQLR